MLHVLSEMNSVSKRKLAELKNTKYCQLCTQTETNTGNIADNIN